MARRLGWRSTPHAIGLVVTLALPFRAAAAPPGSLPDAAAARAGADLWFDTHIAPSLRAPHLESPEPVPGPAAPAPEDPLPARAIGRRWLAGGSPPPQGTQDDLVQPVWIWLSLQLG